MKKQTLRFILLATLLIAAGPPARGTDRQIVAGREDRWEDFRRDHLALRPGRWNTLDLVLPDSEYVPTSTTDLLLHFNGADVGCFERREHQRCGRRAARTPSARSAATRPGTTGSPKPGS